MTTYNQLRSTSFHLNVDRLKPIDLYVLRYPSAWRQPLRELFESAQRNPDKYKNLPISALNDALGLLAPDLVCPDSYTAAWKGEEWLYAKAPIPVEGIARIVRAWIHTLGRNKDRSAEDHRLLCNALAAVQPDSPGWDEFAWEPRTFDFAALTSPTGPSGTAVPDPIVYRLLPHLLVDELAALGRAWPHGQAGGVEFRRSATHDGAEAISWPPANEAVPFSYKIKLQVQTVPGRSNPAIYANFGVRRWLYKSVKLPRNVNSRVCLTRSSSLLDETGRSRAFRQIGITWRPGQGVDWTSRLHPVLEHLALRPELPNPTELAGDPRAHLERSTADDGVAIVYNTSMAGKHAVEPGLSVRERRELFEWVSDTLEPWIQPDEPFTRTFGPRAFASSPRSVKTSAAREHARLKRETRDAATKPGADPTPAIDALPHKYAALVQSGLARVLQDGTLAVEAHYFDDSKLPDLLQAAIGSYLGPGAASAGTHHWQVGRGNVVLTRNPIRGELADKIDVPKNASTAAIRNALIDRTSQIERTLSTASNSLTASVVEINERDYYQDRPITDPKPAFRLAHANAGRVSQFATPPTGETSDPERLSRSWLDLLRQLGVQVVPAEVKIRNLPLPDPLYYVAVWVVRTNKTKRRSYGRHVPVMVYLDSTGEQQPQIVSPYFDDWMDYPAGLIKLARDGRFETESRTEENKQYAQKFITDRIRDVTALRRDTLLLTDASNLRGDWPFIRNDNLLFDHLEEQAIEGTGLRHVRVRSHSNNLEVPEVWGIGTDQKTDWGLSAGLWHMHGERVFASTADKPAQAGSTLHGLSKLEPTTRTPRTKDGEEPTEVEVPPVPGAAVWNARVVEMTAAALQPGDDPRAWVAIAHQLRWANLQYDGATALPMPLHLASLAEEYVLGTHVATQLLSPE